MSDKEIEKMITAAVDSIPIPWEQLWAVFQKILQRTLREREDLLQDKDNI